MGKKRGSGPLDGFPRQATIAQKTVLVLAGIVVGYLLGYVLMETADTVYASHRELLDKQHAAMLVPADGPPRATSRMDGRSIHTVVTSNGSPYQAFQARIM